MKDNILADYFINACEAIGVSICEDEISKFFKYKDLLISWNEKINLTAITSDKDIILKHFVDSLTLLEFINDGAEFIDIGTGAGFPGLPLKIMKDSIRLTLLDSLKKRVIFLEEAVDKLKLTNVYAVHERAENAGRNEQYREKFDIAVSRAVAPLRELSEYCIPFVKTGGHFIAMKGADADNEINEAKSAICALGGEITHINNISLRTDGDKRTLIKISKIKNTPANYPRKAGIPSKRPL